MDDLTKALENYKNAFKQKLDNYVLDAIPVLKPETSPQKKPVKSENENVERKIEIHIRGGSKHQEETPKEQTVIKPKLDNGNIAPTDSAESSGENKVNSTKPKTNNENTQNPIPPEPQPPQPPTPLPSPAPIKRHIMHRVITSTGARFGLALLLLLFL